MGRLTAGKAYDVSLLLGQEDIAYPGDRPYSREVVSSVESGADYSLSDLAMSAHSGTHLDFPAHLVGGGMTADQYPVEQFLMPALVLDAPGEISIGPGVMEGLEIDMGGALLFRTDNSLRGLWDRGAFCERFSHLSKEAAMRCVDLGATLVGTDYVSVDALGDEAVHRILLEKGVLILEGLNLKNVPPGRYTLICLPLKIKYGEASPIRAVLLEGPWA